MLDQISADLQKELPGLKGFSSGNLKKIRIFAEAYAPHIVIGSTVSNLIENKGFYEAFTGIILTPSDKSSSKKSLKHLKFLLVTFLMFIAFHFLVF